MSKILLVGDSCTDVFIYGDVMRLCPEAPVPILNPRHQITCGGMAKNVEANLSALGIDCDMITNSNWKEIKKVRYLDENTNQMIVRVDKNDSVDDKLDINSINYNDYEIIIISDYDKGFINRKDIEIIGSKHDCVFLDTKKPLNGWCKTANFIKINKVEYEKSVDISPEILKEINDKIIITIGNKGCKYQNEIFGVENVEIKDLSGAGDTFLAGLVTKYLEVRDMGEAIKFANLCATEVVQKRGVTIIGS